MAHPLPGRGVVRGQIPPVVPPRPVAVSKPPVRRAGESKDSPGPPKPRTRKAAPPRLPDKSEFRVVFDVLRMRWSGWLTIGSLKWTGNAPSVFGLLTRLDKMYRDWVHEQNERRAQT